MVSDSVAYLRAHDRRVFLDAEHFFDGYAENSEFSLRILQAAAEAGAETLVLCDTNGGTLPFEVEAIVAEVFSRFETQVGVHFHNDSGCAVANSLAAVRVGATHVQGCINGYGERAGNTDLSAAIPDLSLKLRITTIPGDRLERLTPVSHHIAELVNIAPNPQQPYVGASVFAHKAGLHTSAIVRRSDAYEHVDPELVGNGTRFVVSEMAGRSTLALKADELGLDLDSQAASEVLDTLKQLEYEGYHFEVADGSLELLAAAGDGLEPALLRARVLPSDLRPRRPPVDRSHRQGLRRRRTHRRDGRRQRSGERPRRRPPGRARPAAPVAGARAPRRLPGTGARLGPRDGFGDPGAHRLGQRRSHVDDHRSVGEHHRRLVAGPCRFDRLRSPPHRSRRCHEGAGRQVCRSRGDPTQLRPYRRGRPGPSRVPAARAQASGHSRALPRCGRRRRRPGLGWERPGPTRGSRSSWPGGSRTGSSWPRASRSRMPSRAARQ